MIWFSSDLHLGHQNIIKYCNRPFQTAKEMDEVIIQNFNEVVKDNDWVFHLGDFTFKDTKPYLDRLKGKHHLIRGNHDVKNPQGFVWVKDTFLLNVSPTIRIYLSHYAHRTWPNTHHGSIHLYGHSHGKLTPFGRSFDVGVDTNDFKPYSIEDIVEKAAKLKPEFLVCEDPLDDYK